MDPAWIAILGTIGGGLLIRGIEAVIRPKVKAIAYENRWTNTKYINSIHQIQKDEQFTLGKIFTECHCKDHTPVVYPKPPPGPGAGSPRKPNDVLIIDGRKKCQKPGCFNYRTMGNKFCHYHKGSPLTSSSNGAF